MLGHDLRQAIRRLRRAPGFTAVALLTLAIGIGANSAIFSVVNSVLLRPLPYPGPDRLVRLYDIGDGRPMTMSPPNFLDYRARSDLFEVAAAWYVSDLALTGGESAERTTAAYVTSDFFRTLRTPPAVGRAFDSVTVEASDGKVVVLGHALWTQRFGQRPDILGSTVELDAESYRVVGVMPAAFDFPSDVEAWVPLTFTGEDLAGQRGAHYLSGIARLRDGIAASQANAELAALGQRLAAEYPESNTGYEAGLMVLRDWLVRDARPALLILLGAVGLVLLIACVNVANLLLARGVSRQRELAVKTAMGASRLRLLRELLAEALVLAAAGGALALLMAFWSTELLASLELDGLPRLDRANVDARVVAFTAGVSLGTGLLFGLLPAFQVSNVRRLAQQLKDGSRGAGASERRTRLRALLVVSEVAFAVVLLAGAGLLIRSFLEIQRVDPGFDPDGVLTFEVSLPDASYPERERVQQFYEQYLSRLAERSGIERVGAVFGLPLSGMSYTISISRLDGVPPASPAEEQSTGVRVVTPGYFRTLGMSLERGRSFTTADREGAPPVIIVNEAAAAHLWPGQDPIGHQVVLGTRMGGAERIGGTVVGVVRNVRHEDLRSEPEPEMYFPQAQVPVDNMTIVIRPTGPIGPVIEAAREELRAIDPSIPLYDARTMERVVAESVAQPRFYMTLLAIFAGVALLLASVGIYGVLAYAVGQRTHEIGVRMAVGARGEDVLGLVVRDGMRLAVVGTAIGVVGAIAVTRLLRALLYAVEPTDPLTIGGVAFVLLFTAFVASAIPARRAARVDPVTALRAE